MKATTQIVVFDQGFLFQLSASNADSLALPEQVILWSTKSVDKSNESLSYEISIGEELNISKDVWTQSYFSLHPRSTCSAKEKHASSRLSANKTPRKVNIIFKITS